MKEKDIIELLKAGQVERAFTRLYKIYPKVRSMLKKYGALNEECRDIFQDALVVLYRKSLETGFGTGFSLEAYLVNTCKYMFIRTRKKPAGTILPEEVPAAEPEWEMALIEDRKVKQAEAALLQIGEKCRHILTSFYVHKKTMAEIATLFTLGSEDAAKMHKYRCLLAVKKIYNQLLNS